MKFSTIIIFLLLSLNLFSQGNLQFNQVIIRDFTVNNLGTPSSAICSPSTISVPAGKVWKIEQASVYIDTYTNSTSTGVTYSLFVGNSLVSRNVTSLTPLWLPEGTYTIKIVTDTFGNPYSNSYKASINAIEFNIIP
jgi:hypothetical protein